MKARDMRSPPAGCRCWNKWGMASQVTPICSDYVAGAAGCMKCEHDEECHATDSKALSRQEKP